MNRFFRGVLSHRKFVIAVFVCCAIAGAILSLGVKVNYTFADYLPQNTASTVALETMNEEFDGSYSEPNKEYYQNINDYNQIFVDTVRKTGDNNTKRWLIIPGWNTNIDYTAGDYGFKLPTDQYRDKPIDKEEQRIMISVHYYSPWDFCGGENGVITQ